MGFTGHIKRSEISGKIKFSPATTALGTIIDKFCLLFKNALAWRGKPPVLNVEFFHRNRDGPEDIPELNR